MNEDFLNENEEKELAKFLCFIKYIGIESDGFHSYEFFFTHALDIFWGDDFSPFKHFFRQGAGGGLFVRSAQKAPLPSPPTPPSLPHSHATAGNCGECRKSHTPQKLQARHFPGSP